MFVRLINKLQKYNKNKKRKNVMVKMQVKSRKNWLCHFPDVGKMIYTILTHLLFDKMPINVKCNINKEEIMKEKKYTEKIFDDIKHFNEFGVEYWLARELQKVLEYKKW